MHEPAVSQAPTVAKPLQGAIVAAHTALAPMARTPKTNTTLKAIAARDLIIFASSSSSLERHNQRCCPAASCGPPIRTLGIGIVSQKPGSKTSTKLHYLSMV